MRNLELSDTIPAVIPSAVSDPLPAVPDGLRLSDWIETAGVSRSTAYALLKIAGIEPEQRKVPGSRKPVSFLAGDALARMDALAQASRDGATLPQIRERFAAFAGQSGIVSADLPAGAIVPAGRSEIVPNSPPDSPKPSESMPVRERLAALRDAIELGAPLTTAEAEQLLGSRLSGDRVVRGRVAAIREGRNCWRLEMLPPS